MARRRLNRIEGLRVELDRAHRQQIVLALVYLVATLVLGFGAAALGFWIAARRGPPPPIEVDE